MQRWHAPQMTDLRPQTTSTPDIDLGGPIYADDYLLALNKPPGLLSVPGRGPDRQDCLSTRVQQDYPDALIVHRLDMSTSGLIVMARGKLAQRQLSAAFAGRQVWKRYQALVDGLVQADAGEVDLPLICDWPHRPRQMIDHTHGKPSQTRFRVLSRDLLTRTTRVELEPITGRSHQLRVHLQALGHPILGDELYAPANVHQRSPRLMLHACELTVPHPHTQQPLRLVCATPF